MQSLTEGAIPIVSSYSPQTDGFNPILQVVEIQPFIPKIPSFTSENDRYRIVLSDGVYSYQCMLSTRLNELVHSRCIQNGSLVKLTDFVCTFVQNRRIVIIFNLHMMLEKCDPIGKPVPLKMDGATILPPINLAVPSFSSRDDYEIFLGNMSVIQPSFGDDNLVPKTKFRFRPINEIQGIEEESVIDVIGVVSSISPSILVFRKNGTEIQKRSLQLKDMSGMSIDVTLWGKFCNKEGDTLHTLCDSGDFPVLAIKSCKVNDYEVKSLGTISSSQLLIEPHFPEAHELKAWLERDGKNTPSISISMEKKNMNMIHTDVLKTISQIKDERVGTSEKPDCITVCATLTFIEVDNVVYTACPIMVGDRKCHRKVTSIGDGKWRCDRCCQVVDECEYRYALQFQIQDHTGFAWVTGIQESGEGIFGAPARELYLLKYEKEDHDKFAEILHFARFRKYLFELRVKEETFGVEQRVKSIASRVEKVNFASDTKYLFNLIYKLKVQSVALSDGPLISTSGTGMLVIPNAAMKYGGSSGSVIKEHAQSAYLAGPNRYQFNVSAPSSLPSTVIVGHSSTNCPNSMNPHEQCPGDSVGNRAVGATRGRPVASVECFKCRRLGHWAKDCPTMNILPPADGYITPTKYWNISREH